MKYSKLLRQMDPSLKTRTGGNVPYQKMTHAGWQVRRVRQEDGDVVLELSKHTSDDDCLRMRVRTVA